MPDYLPLSHLSSECPFFLGRLDIKSFTSRRLTSRIHPGSDSLTCRASDFIPAFSNECATAERDNEEPEKARENCAMRIVIVIFFTKTS
jgi:hypothetical protein